MQLNCEQSVFTHQDEEVEAGVTFFAGPNIVLTIHVDDFIILGQNCIVIQDVNGTQLPSTNHLPSSLLSHRRKAVGKPLHLQSPLKWCGISITIVLASSCVYVTGALTVASTPDMI